MATSSTRDGVSVVSEESNEQSFLNRPSGWLANVRQFWREVASEMKKVSWPSRHEVTYTTIIVIVAVLFFAVYLFLADIFFTYVIRGIEWGAAKIFG
jgi:preprotein translocase subunit SecE